MNAQFAFNHCRVAETKPRALERNDSKAVSSGKMDYPLVSQALQQSPDKTVGFLLHSECSGRSVPMKWLAATAKAS